VKRLRDIALHPYAGSYGARVSDEQEPTNASPLRYADDQTLDWARNYWPEADADDFEWGLGGLKVRHKETGEILKIRLGYHVGGELASDIQTFCVRDQRLVLLGRPGSERPTTVHHGTFGGRKIEYAGPPQEGSLW
jgi:hypothetical protein